VTNKTIHLHGGTYFADKSVRNSGSNRRDQSQAALSCAVVMLRKIPPSQVSPAPSSIFAIGCVYSLDRLALLGSGHLAFMLLLRAPCLPPTSSLSVSAVLTLSCLEQLVWPALLRPAGMFAKDRLTDDFSLPRPGIRS
jgi:hypothetical protein